MEKNSMQSSREEKPIAIESLNRYPVGNPFETTYFSSAVNWITSIPNRLFGSISSALIYPAQFQEPAYLVGVDSLERQYTVTMRPYTVVTHDKAELNSIEITPTDVLPYQFVIIKFNGNNMLYESRIQEMINDARELKATVIGFNHRGVSQSTGKVRSRDDLLVDGIAQVQRLLKLGVKPEQIVLDGISLGGAIATLVAFYFFQKGQHIFLFNDRSFADIEKVATGIICKDRSACAQTSFESTAAFLLKLTAWNIDASTAYRLLLQADTAHTAHMYVDEASSQNVGDGVIGHPASLHEAVKDLERGYRMYCRFFPNGHNAPREKLMLADSKVEKNGETVFHDFVKEKRSMKRT